MYAVLCTCGCPFSLMFKVTDGYFQRRTSVLFYKSEKIKNDLLTFPKWIICTDVSTASPSRLKVVGAV